MRQSFRRAGLLAMAALLTLAGMVAVAGTASAGPRPHTLLNTVRVQSCAFPSGCPVDVRDNPSGTPVTSFCISDIFHLVYTGPIGRGGFVNRTLLSNPGTQTANCATTGTPTKVKSTVAQTVLRSCSSANCVNFGTAQRQDAGGAWCHLPPDLTEWVLVYMNRIGRAGFIQASALDGVPNVPSCA